MPTPATHDTTRHCPSPLGPPFRAVELPSSAVTARSWKKKEKKGGEQEKNI
jgi:hypothetical protein